MKQPARNIYRLSFFNFAGIILGFSIILLLWQASAASVYGQSQPNLPGVDQTFTPKFSRAGSIWKSIPQPDGKIILIGGFNLANGVERRNFVRLNPDYSVDETFNPPSNISLDSLELLPDGKLICHAYGSGIFRLNQDGSVDPSFNFGRSLEFGGDLDVRLKPRSDGKIIVFGRFRAKKQRLVVAEDFMLLDQFGGIESGFRPAFTGYVGNVFPLPDGRTILTGTFEISRAGKAVGRNFAVLDENGSPIPGFDGFYGKAGESVDGARIQPDGRILLYGTFTEVSKQTVLGRAVSKNKQLLRLNADGSFDRDFSFSPTAARLSLSTVFLQPDGGIIITGGSGLYYYEMSSFVSRLFPDGSPDNFFNNNLPFQPLTPHEPSSIKMEMTADGGWLMSGNFRVTGRPEIQKLIKLNSNGTLDESFRTPPIIGGVRTG
ncbi:MAG: hypothetical protein M3384_07520, partial [Acidobacteriota bacterium]|nr:hypothetical protein [Acidobacteriota bacterium]